MLPLQKQLNSKPNKRLLRVTFVPHCTVQYREAVWKSHEQRILKNITAPRRLQQPGDASEG